MGPDDLIGLDDQVVHLGLDIPDQQPEEAQGHEHQPPQAHRGRRHHQDGAEDGRHRRGGDDHPAHQPQQEQEGAEGVHPHQGGAGFIQDLGHGRLRGGKGGVEKVMAWR